MSEEVDVKKSSDASEGGSVQYDPASDASVAGAIADLQKPYPGDVSGPPTLTSAADVFTVTAEEQPIWDHAATSFGAAFVGASTSLCFMADGGRAVTGVDEAESAKRAARFADALVAERRARQGFGETFGMLDPGGVA